MQGHESLQYCPEQGGMLYDPSSEEWFSVQRRLWTVGGHWPAEPDVQHANGTTAKPVGDANAVLGLYLELPVVERLRFALMLNQSEEGYTLAEVRRVNAQTRGIGVNIFDRQAFANRYGTLKPVQGFAGLEESAANGPSPLFPPPLQLVRRKDVYGLENIDDLVRAAGGDPVLAQWSVVPPSIQARLPWPDLRRVRLAPTASGDAIFAVTVRTDLVSGVAFVFRLPGGRWETGGTSAAGSTSGTTLGGDPAGAPPANGGEWYNDLLGGVHVAGRTVLGAFGLEKVGRQLEDAEGEALPDWARSAQPGRIKGRSEIPGGGEDPSTSGRPPIGTGGDEPGTDTLPIPSEPSLMAAEETAPDTEQVQPETEATGDEPSAVPQSTGRILGRQSASRRPTAPPIDRTARRGSPTNPVRSRTGGL